MGAVEIEVVNHPESHKPVRIILHDPLGKVPDAELRGVAAMEMASEVNGVMHMRFDLIVSRLIVRDAYEEEL